MRLFLSLTSPFARMCRAVIIEKGLQDQVEAVVVNPYDDPQLLLDVSPTGTVPVLVRDDGGAPIPDSRLICAWLDHLPSDAPPLLPAGGVERMMARLGEAAGQSLADKSVALTMEKRRPEGVQHGPYKARLEGQILRAIGALSGHIGDVGAPSTLSTIAMACGLGHIEFRHGDLPWRAQSRDVAAWYDGFIARDSMANTMPPHA